MSTRSIDYMLEREGIANTPKHWVRAVTACNSKCIFCLDSDTPRGVFLPEAEVKAELDRGLSQGAEKVIISGGEASLHPRFVDFVRYAKERGYKRVQTVTNGFKFQDRAFYEACMDAGLGEITFSLHGHTAELHNRLTQTEDAFEALIKGMVRAVRDRRAIVNVDVVINKQNVAYLDKIVELCLSLGVSEFDLLHVIPQAAAFDHRDELFYDVKDHLPVLQKVFRLTRHPGVTVWTNRFPVEFLEGLEDLIQDPHKMLDEVNGRRFHVRRYLDLGTPLECRQPERCKHCFIEPFCTSMDRVVADQNAERWQVYWIGRAAYAGEALPFGCTRLGVEIEHTDELAALPLPAGIGVYVRPATAAPLPALAHAVTPVWVAHTAEQLAAWLPALPIGAELEIELNRGTAPWLYENQALLSAVVDRVTLVQPTHEHLKAAHAQDVRTPASFFEAMRVPGLRVANLPVCLTPGAVPVDALRRLDATLFNPKTGRLEIQPLAHYHISERYRGKSVRCGDCRVKDRCEGLHINMIRDQGLGMLAPLVDGAEAERCEALLLARHPEPLQRLGNGRLPEPAARSLAGHAQPTDSETDPLALIEISRMLKKQARARGESLPQKS
jgi:pyruvate-formate lyase-activating enzyme